jgi:hypothetical protein
MNKARILHGRPAAFALGALLGGFGWGATLLATAQGTAAPPTTPATPPAAAPTPTPTPPAIPPHLCQTDPAFHKLDFWVGRWDVFAEGQKDGTNVIEKVLDGCAVIENWLDVEGHEGKSLFYYNRVTGKRKQVWVTDQGPLKEKEEVPAPEPGSVRFQGEIPLRGGGTVFDRTTLTPLPDGRVRQVIEQSRDGGKTWKVGFDAIYVRQKGTSK